MVSKTAHLTSTSSRRKFLKNIGVVAAAFSIIPRSVLGKGFVAPSDTLYLAGIGAGGKGESDLAEMAKSPNVKVVALCDVDDRQAVKSVQNFPTAKYYKDFRKLLDAEKNIDACTVSTPDHTHAVVAMAAIVRGKHVYVQKPLTHDIYEARILTEAARKYKVVTQMGNQGGSGDDVRKAKEWYDAGLIGDVFNVTCWTNRPVWPQGVPTPQGKFEIPKELDWNLWLGTAPAIDYNPAYLPFNWRGWWNFGTGALGDMACHIMDPVFRILPIDYPSEVECSVSTIWSGVFQEGKYSDSCPVSSIVHFKYPGKNGKPDIDLTWMDGGLLPKRPAPLLPDEPMGNWDGGVIFEGTKGKLMCDCYGANPRLLPTKRMTEVTLPKQTLPRVPEGHYLQWANACMKGFGKSELSSSFDYAGPFTESVLMGNLAIRSYNVRVSDSYPGRKKLLWDAKNMKITNFDEANKYVRRDYSNGWTL
jgi:predicted dehydrogenase